CFGLRLAGKSRDVLDRCPRAVSDEPPSPTVSRGNGVEANLARFSTKSDHSAVSAFLPFLSTASAGGMLAMNHDGDSDSTGAITGNGVLGFSGALRGTYQFARVDP